jgi:hypothetical protein
VRESGFVDLMCGLHPIDDPQYLAHDLGATDDTGGDQADGITGNAYFRGTVDARSRLAPDEGAHRCDTVPIEPSIIANSRCSSRARGCYLFFTFARLLASRLSRISAL